MSGGKPGQKNLCCSKRKRDLPEKGKHSMWCVMHVKPGNEKRAEQFIDGLFGGESQGRCFHLTRARRKKYGGCWRTIQEELLPGYVFIATDEPEKLYGELEKAPGYRLVGSGRESVSCLGEEEADFLEKIAGERGSAGKIGLSYIRAGEDGGVTVVSGPLLSVERQVRKIDFHKRIAEVETEFCGEKRVMYLGVEFADVR